MRDVLFTAAQCLAGQAKFAGHLRERLAPERYRRAQKVAQKRNWPQQI